MSSAVAQAALRLPTRAAVSLRLSTHSPRPAAPPRRRLLPPTHRERSLAVAAHAASGAAPAVLAPNPPAARPSCPPEEYDHNAALRARSVAFCRASFPELADLVEAGVLIVIERPADYVERREDGYQCAPVCLLLSLARHSGRSRRLVPSLPDRSPHPSVLSTGSPRLSSWWAPRTFL